MLSKKEWLLAILKYCAEASEDGNYSLLDGLPFELTLGNEIYKLGQDTLLDDNPRLEIFQNNKSLFLNVDIVDLIKDASVLPTSWLKPTLKNYLTVLHQYINEYQFTKEWLTSLVDFINKADKDEFNEACDEIKKLQVVYQLEGDYACLEADRESPVLVEKEDIKSIEYLKKIGINIVRPDYIEIYKPLSKHDELITILTPKSLINYLVYLPVEDYSFFEDKETRDYLVDILAKDISWYEELSEEEKGRLEDMSFIATENDNLYAISTDKRLYLPAGFTPPKHIDNLKGGYEIVSFADDRQFEMYKKMGVEEQTFINYLEEIIIPFITLENKDDIVTILKWLSTNWEELTVTLHDEEKNKLIRELKTSNIILNKSKSFLEKTSNFYCPNFFETLPVFIQDNKFNPISFDDEFTQKKWIEFLSILGSSVAILAQHIINKVEEIIEDNNQKDAISLLNYISNKFEIFEDMQYEEEQVLVYLKKYAWFPVEKPKNILKPDGEYSLLKPAEELILSSNYKIAGGANFVLSKEVKLGKKDENGEYTKEDIAKKMGIKVNLPNECIFKSFRKLVAVDTINSQTNNEVLNYAKEFYKFLGRKSQLSENEVPNDIKEKSIRINHQWVSSKKVFKENIILSGVFCWNSLVRNEIGSQLTRGLELLGVKERPDMGFLVDALNQLPRNNKLSENQLNDAKAILKILQEDEDSNFSYYEELPLLSRSNQLVDHTDLFINDLPAYNKAENKNKELVFCQAEFDRIAKILDVRSLAESINSSLNAKESQLVDAKELNENARPDIFIKAEPFKGAVLRLLYHEGRISESEINHNALVGVFPSDIYFAKKLVIDYLIDSDFVYQDSDATTFVDNDEDSLYILEQDEIDDMSASISSFICNSNDLTRESFSYLDRIIRKTMSKDDINVFLDKNKIKALPENLKIEEYSIYGEPESSGQVQNSDENTNVNSYDQPQEEPEIYDTFTEDEKNEPSGLEIDPPIRPKVPGDEAVNKKRQTSGGHNEKSKQGSIYSSNNSTTKKIVSSNDRMPVYVGKDKEVDEETQNNQKERAKEIGNKGESFILSNPKNYLLSETNHFEKAPENNKGFDIHEKDAMGNTVRYIEAKTLTGKWGAGGVGITVSQLEFAQNNNNWWLFVIENINTNNTNVFQFKNPILEANKFMFDNSWKQLAYSSKTNMAKNTPKVGDLYDLGEDDNIYEVLRVKEKGKFYLLKLRASDTQEIINKKFSPSWNKQ